MSKPLTWYPESERRVVAERRVSNASGGIGKAAAQDYLALKKAPAKVKRVEEVKEK